ncbi:uncharacterized protein LOC143193396 [Rhynchophorus ferrugineus]|uniref:uncharacterized protein LOC143193396 n=1 Tax=Rhynchophorus ferrugineus TaxID=354439 RepID=UPI003FCDFA03
MLLPLLIVSCILGYVFPYPQNVDIKEITKSAPPEEVNAIQGDVDVPSGISNSIATQSIEDTIKEVEDLIKTNPKLPRLTRGEILDILDNLTRQDNNVASTLGKESHRDPKSLMVVKAYTPAGSGQVNIEELYTKQPITSIVEDENETAHAEHLEGTVKTSTTSSRPTIASTVSSMTPGRIEFHKKRQKLPQNDVKKDIEKNKPARQNVPIKKPLSNNISTERPSTAVPRNPTPRPDVKKRRRPYSSTTGTPILDTTYQSRTPISTNHEIKHPNHKYPDEYTTKSPVYIPEHIKVVTPPSIAPTEINYELEDLIPQEGERHNSFVPGPPASNKNKLNAMSEPSIEIEIPEHLKNVVANLNLAAIQDAKSATTSNTKANKETENIQNVLASIGLYPVETSTTTPQVPNAQIMEGNLSEDMQNLLKSFGLLPDPNQNSNINDEAASFNPEKAEIRPEAYVGFKPLPEDTQSRKEMESLLAQFGLLEKKPKKTSRTGREYLIRNTKSDLQLDDINLDIVPDDLKPVLHEMGFVSGSRAGRKIREKPHGNNTAEYQSKDALAKQQHVFSPMNSEYVSDEEVQKLGKLLDIVKTLAEKNGTITEEDMKKVNPKELNELIASLNIPTDEMVPLNQQIAPNPIEYDFGLNKNEIKRQEVSTEASTTTTSTIEESRTPSIKDLEDSFGGQSETVTETPEPPSTTPQNGFYYLLDWNSFFEIDDQKGKRVNLRFQPHVGDPKRFLSVSVP